MKNSLKTMLLVLSAVLLLNSVALAKKPVRPEPVEPMTEKTIIIRTPENFVWWDAADTHLELFKNEGITTIILLVKNDEDLPHMDSGEVFYDSSIAPKAFDYQESNLDALRYVGEFCKANGIKLYAWVPQFHDKVVIIKNNSDLQMIWLNPDTELVEFYNPNNEWFVNPSHPEVQNYQRSILAEIATNYGHLLTGIYLDWVRFDDYNMDLSDSVRAKFQALYGIDPISINFSTENDTLLLWNKFREDIIANYIIESANLIKSIDPNLEVGIFVLPVAMHEVAQDPSRFEDAIDWVSPMLYNDDWGYPQSWIYETAISDIMENMSDDSKIIPTLDLQDCGDAALWQKIIATGITRKNCFWYWDWTPETLDMAFPRVLVRGKKEKK
ncbi:MAG: family 10 glycosylhydrolase [Candidatus Moranbacteria bacterium]|nr:family 10 glycosylhydrolase [Candidatus Moranbacteria bacterium]